MSAVSSWIYAYQHKTKTHIFSCYIPQTYIHTYSWQRWSPWHWTVRTGSESHTRMLHCPPEARWQYSNLPFAPWRTDWAGGPARPGETTSPFPQESWNELGRKWKHWWLPHWGWLIPLHWPLAHLRYDGKWCNDDVIIIVVCNDEIMVSCMIVHRNTSRLLQGINNTEQYHFKSDPLLVRYFNN